MKLIHILITITILLTLSVIGTKLKKYKEALTEREFIQEEIDFYKYRESGNLMGGLKEANSFLAYNPTKPIGEQLVHPSSGFVSGLDGGDNKIVTSTDNDVDTGVQQCSSITTCQELDNTPCGYCFYNNKFGYGDENGPLTDVCPGGWVKTTSQCLEKRERAVCETVKNCKEMVGDAAICAWCPTKNKAFVYKEQGGILVPKYSKDICKDVDITTGKSLGLVKQDDCDKFSNEHPCIGPNEDTGPHSMSCLSHLWKTAGGSSKGTVAPQNSARQGPDWNKQGWEPVYDDMKNWVKDANSNDWNSVKSHYKGVYGTDPEPCDNKYNPLPVECYQKLFTANGCSTKGSGYPTGSNSNYTTYKGTYSTMQKFIDYIKSLVSTSKDSNAVWSDKNKANENCYGNKLDAPMPPKPGDFIQYFFVHPTFGKSVIKGFIASIPSPGFVTVFWTEAVINNKTYNRIDTSIQEQINVLGAVAGQTPFGLEGMNVPGQIDINNIQILNHCDGNSNSSSSNCELQHIIYLEYYGSSSYSIKLEQISDVLSKLNNAYPNGTISTLEDIQYLINAGVGNCAYGWAQNGDEYNCVLPSVRNSSPDCGGGAVKIFNSGTSTPGWSGGKAGLYARVIANPNDITSKLKKAGLKVKIVATIGKDHYQSMKAEFIDGSNLDINKHDMNYIGCYIDKPSRALPHSLGNRLSFDQARQKAINAGYRYFGLQDTNDFGNKASQGWAGNNSDYDKYGKSNKCINISDNKRSNYSTGKSWVNAVYSV